MSLDSHRPLSEPTSSEAENPRKAFPWNPVSLLVGLLTFFAGSILTVVTLDLSWVFSATFICAVLLIVTVTAHYLTTWVKRIATVAVLVLPTWFGTWDLYHRSIQTQKQRLLNSTNEQAIRALRSSSEKSRLREDFPLGWQVLTLDTANGNAADLDTWVPPTKTDKALPLIHWPHLGTATVTLREGQVVFPLPDIGYRGVVVSSNVMSLKLENGIAYSLDVGPYENDKSVVFSGMSLFSDWPKGSITLGPNPAVSIEVRIEAVTKEGAIVVVGARPYSAEWGKTPPRFWKVPF